MAGLLDLEEERRKNLAPINPRSIAGLLGTVGENPNARMMSMAQDYARNLPQQLATNQAAMDKAIGGWNRTDFATGQANPNYYPEAVNELTQLMPNFAGMIAYHGTPHNILGKFDISKVGTGEGAQAYGHGMYFAENPEVATQYRKMLSTPYKETASASQLLDMAHGNYDEALKLAQRNKNIAEIHSGKAEHIESANKTLDILNKMKKGEKLEFGNLYKVDIPDEYIPNMLDWDKPLSEQPKAIQKALGLSDDKFAGFKVPATGTNYSFSPKMTGAEFYKELTDLAKTQSGASEMLNSMGVKGISYLDEGSRGNYRAQTTYKGEPYSDMLSFKTKGQLDDFIKEKEAEGFGVNTFPQTSNFVVFDPSTVKILEKNKKKVGLLD